MFFFNTSKWLKDHAPNLDTVGQYFFFLPCTQNKTTAHLNNPTRGEYSIYSFQKSFRFIAQHTRIKGGSKTEFLLYHAPKIIMPLSHCYEENNPVQLYHSMRSKTYTLHSPLLCSPDSVTKILDKDQSTSILVLQHAHRGILFLKICTIEFWKVYCILFESMIHNKPTLPKQPIIYAANKVLPFLRLQVALTIYCINALQNPKTKCQSSYLHVIFWPYSLFLHLFALFSFFVFQCLSTYLN